MSPRSLRILETALVSAFVSFGVAAAVLHATEPTVVADSCETKDVLAPLLRSAVEADAGLGSLGNTFDQAGASRVESLYTWYADQHDKLASSSTVDWARTRASEMRQLQGDLAEMQKLEAEAVALEAVQSGL